MTGTTCITARALAAGVHVAWGLATHAFASEQPSSAGRGFGFVYDPAQVTLVGTVKGSSPSHRGQSGRAA
jgi:hypothetical protein